MVPDFLSVPEHIRILLYQMTQVEEMLITPIVPFMSVLSTSSGHPVYSGFSANFRQDVIEFMKSIPLSLAQLRIMFVLRPDENNNMHACKVNQQRVTVVARWLVENNPYFLQYGITFSEVNAIALPEDGILNIEEIHSEVQDSHDVGAMHVEPSENAIGDEEERLYHCAIQEEFVTDQEGLARRTLQGTDNDEQPIQTVQWPTINPILMDEFNMQGIASLASPTLFPLVQADPTTKVRIHAVTEQKAAGHLLKVLSVKPNGELYYPFARHARFKFWINDRIRRHRVLGQSTIYLRKNPGDGNLSLDDLRGLLQNHHEAFQVLGRMNAYTANVTGSSSYWKKERNKLLSTIQAKGNGTLFFTLSFADNHLYDLHRLMPNGVRDPRDRHRDAYENAHLVDWWFTIRVETLLKCYFKDDLEWYWLRFEWQSRTCIHAHGIAKLHSDPNLQKHTALAYLGREAKVKLDEPGIILSLEQQVLYQNTYQEGLSSERIVLEYADRMVAANNPAPQLRPPTREHVRNNHPFAANVLDLNPGEEYDLLYGNLVNCCQRHVCSGYCNDDGTCRFHYPRRHQTETKLKFTERSNGRVAASIEYARNDSWTNPHEKILLITWQGNLDVSLILDIHALAVYIAKYASKEEHSGQNINNLLQSVRQAHQVAEESSTNEVRTSRMLRSLMVRSIEARDVGVGECSRQFFSSPHVSSTFKVINISCYLGGQQFARQDNGTTEKPTLIHMYGIRCEEYEEMDPMQSFMEFATIYSVKGDGTLGYRISPNKIIIKPVPHFSSKPNGGLQYIKYCCQQVILHKPWKREDIETLMDETTAVERWNAYLET